MTLADDLKPLVYSIRSIPGLLGLRPYSVAIVSGAWTGNYTGRGLRSDAVDTITEASGQNPKVRELKADEVALLNLGPGAVAIGPITTNFTGGGTALADIQPAVSAGQTVHVRLTGPKHPTGAYYRITSVKTDRALHWMITAEPVANT